jgi:hypothetical protein
MVVIPFLADDNHAAPSWGDMEVFKPLVAPIGAATPVGAIAFELRPICKSTEVHLEFSFAAGFQAPSRQLFLRRATERPRAKLVSGLLTACPFLPF